MTATPAPKTMADLIGIVAAVRMDATDTARKDRESGELTTDGLKKRHANWAIDRKWTQLIDDAESRAAKVVTDRAATLARLRGEVVAPQADVQARILGELTFARRRDLVESLLDKPGTDGLRDHVTAATAEELPVLVEHLRDRAAAGHPAAASITRLVDEAVDSLNPEIATAAEAVSAAEAAAEHVRVQAEDARKAATDPGHQTPAHVDAWASGSTLDAAAGVSL